MLLLYNNTSEIQANSRKTAYNLINKNKKKNTISRENYSFKLSNQTSLKQRKHHFKEKKKFFSKFMKFEEKENNPSFFMKTAKASTV